MDWATGIGIVLFVLGLTGYVAGVYTPYTGRAFSLTVIMAGIALAAIGSESVSRIQ